MEARMLLNLTNVILFRTVRVYTYHSSGNYSILYLFSTIPCEFRVLNKLRLPIQDTNAPYGARIRISFVKIIKEGACSKFVWLSNVGGKKKGGGKHAYLNFIMFFFFFPSSTAAVQPVSQLQVLSSMYSLTCVGHVSNHYLLYICFGRAAATFADLRAFIGGKGKASRRKSVYIMYCGKRENFSVEKIGYFYSCRREMVSRCVCFITVHIRMYRYDKFRGRPIFGAHSCNK